MTPSLVFDLAGLPGPLRHGLLLGSTGRPHLAGLSHLALARPGTQALGLALLRAAWQAAPLDGSLAGALARLDAARPFLPDAVRAVVRVVADHARPPADTGPLAELAARRDHAGLARFLDEATRAQPLSLFWRAHRLDLAFLLGQTERIRELLDQPWPLGIEPVRHRLAGDLAYQTGDWEQAAALYALARPLGRERQASALTRLARRPQAAALLAEVLIEEPWNTTLLLRLHDLLAGLDQACAPLAGETGGVAVCLYTAGKAAELDATLAALAASDLACARITVLDNASPDQTPQVLSAWAERLGPALCTLRLPVNVGAPAARNWLASLPLVRQSAFTAFLDDDALVPPDWLGRFGAAVAAYPRASVWGCLTADLAQPGRLQNADIHLEVAQGDTPTLSSLCSQDLDYGQFAYLRPALSVTGCCHLLRTPDLLDSGGFDIRFSPTQYDDLDHDLRLNLAGRQVVYQGGLKVLHARLSGALLHLDERATAGSLANLRKLAGKHPPEVLEGLRLGHEAALLEDLERKRAVVVQALAGGAP